MYPARCGGVILLQRPAGRAASRRTPGRPRHRPLVPDHQPVPRPDRAGEPPPRHAGDHSRALRSVWRAAATTRWSTPDPRARSVPRPRGRRDRAVEQLSYGGQRLLEIGVALTGQAAGSCCSTSRWPGSPLPSASASRPDPAPRRRDGGAAGRARHRPRLRLRRQDHRDERGQGAGRRHGRNSAQRPGSAAGLHRRRAAGARPSSAQAAAAGRAAPLVDGVNTYYGKSHILHDVALEVREGEAVALLGRNGAGKSSTFKSIMGIVPPQRARHVRQGQEIRASRPRRSRVWASGLVPQGRRLFPASPWTRTSRWAAWRGGAAAGVHWDRERIFEYFPRVREQASIARPTALGRRAADGGDRPRACPATCGSCCSTSRSRGCARGRRGDVQDRSSSCAARSRS